MDADSGPAPCSRRIPWFRVRKLGVATPQPGSLLVPTKDKPHSRSSTTPSKGPHPTQELPIARAESAAPLPSLSAADAKRQTSQMSSDATSSSRLHRPITAVRHRSSHEHHNVSRHRLTQSDAHGGSFKSYRRDKGEDLPHLTAGIAAEKARRELAKLPNEPWGALGNDLRRIASNKSGRAGTGRPGMEEVASLRRASSDPKRQSQPKQRSQVEILLDRAEARKMANRAAVTQKDVDKLRKTTAEAEEELRRRLAAVNKASMDLTRKLDYTYYVVLEKLGNLAAIVQSFHSLSSQSKEMIDNFVKEASLLEKDVSIKVESFKTSFDEQGIRARLLEERGARASAEAQALSARLDKARQRVEAWEEQERVDRRRRSWFWKSTWTVFIVVLVVLFFGLAWREWRSQVDVMGVALRHENGGSGLTNQSLFLERNAMEGMEVPGDVKGFLSDVAERSRPSGKHPPYEAMTDAPGHLMEDERLRALDEL